MTPEERHLELERMHRCLDFSAAVFTAISPPDDYTETVIVEFGLANFDAPLAASNLLCADWRRERLLKELTDTFTTFGPTTCGVFDFAHSAHHVIFDEDLKRELN